MPSTSKKAAAGGGEADEAAEGDQPGSDVDKVGGEAGTAASESADSADTWFEDWLSSRSLRVGWERVLLLRAVTRSSNGWGRWKRFWAFNGDNWDGNDGDLGN